MKILIIENQKKCAEYLIQGLTAEGFTVDWEKNEGNAIWKTGFINYDLLLCNYNLPNKNGVEVLEIIRKNKNRVPFIMMAAKQQLKTKLKFFKTGADDYIIKPFIIGEVLARINAVLRKSHHLEFNIIEHGDLKLDNSNFRVFLRKRELKLRRKEYDLLYFFMRNPGILLTRALILEKVWDMNADPFTNTIDVHVKNIRKKIGDKKNEIIRTIYGRGYEFVGGKSNSFS